MMLDSRKVWKVTKLDFWKKKFVGKTKTTRQKIFLLEYESINDPPTFRKKKCVGKTGEKYDSWVVVQKPLDQSECKFL